jgi:hypothetical protein
MAQTNANLIWKFADLLQRPTITKGVDMKKLLIAAALAALTPLGFAPVAHATGLGDPCWNWHATMQDSSGQTLYCTHTPDSGHGMSWQYTIQDR